jgi:hypothetical protein
VARCQEFIPGNWNSNRTGKQETIEQFMIPVSPIKPITRFRQVSLKMLFRYPTMRPLQNGFYVGNKPMGPREQVARHLGSYQHHTMVRDILILKPLFRTISSRSCGSSRSEASYRLRQLPIDPRPEQSCLQRHQ